MKIIQTVIIYATIYENNDQAGLKQGQVHW